MKTDECEDSEKTCSKCKVKKSSNNFYKNNTEPDNLHRWCKICVGEWQKEYNITHRERLSHSRREWVKSSPKMKAYLARPDVKEKQRLRKRKWDRSRASDPLFRLNNNVRTAMCHALKGKKGFRKWETLVGYTLEDLIQHITPQLNESMTWDNYGTEWHIDHITPKSWFKYTSAEDPSFKECWSLNNFQPKLKTDNIRKGNRWKG